LKCQSAVVAAAVVAADVVDVAVNLVIQCHWSLETTLTRFVIGDSSEKNLLNLFFFVLKLFDKVVEVKTVYFCNHVRANID